MLEGGSALRDHQVVVAVSFVDMRPLGPDALAAAAPQVMPLTRKLHRLEIELLQPDLGLARKIRVGRYVIPGVPDPPVVIEE